MKVSLRCGYSPGPSNNEDMTCSCGATSGLRAAGGLDTKGVDMTLYTSIDPAARQKFQKNERTRAFVPAEPLLVTASESSYDVCASHSGTIKRSAFRRTPISTGVVHTYSPSAKTSVAGSVKRRTREARKYSTSCMPMCPPR